MKINNKFLGVLLIAVVACTVPSFKDIANQKIKDFLTTHKEISATYTIAHENNIIAEGVQGFFNKEKQTLLQVNQQMPIASGTKQMTAAMILRLQERGLLSIQDTLAKILPADSGWWPNNQVPEWANKVNLHHLLTHTSGLAEYIPVLKFDVALGHEKIKHLIAEYIVDTPLTGEPGEKYTYTNSGYFFLGVVIETLMKQDIATIFKNEFFDPLEMTNTHMASFNEAIKFQQDQLENYPYRYFAIPTGAAPQYMPAKVDFFLVPYSDGGVVSTTGDLVKWNRAFHNGKVVSDYSYKLMTTPYNVANDLMMSDVKIGYGVYIHTLEDGQVVYYHAGRAVGIRCEHGYMPSSKLYFAVLSNVMIYEPDELKGKIDYTNPANQIDIGFLRSVIWNLALENKN